MAFNEVVQKDPGKGQKLEALTIFESGRSGSGLEWKCKLKNCLKEKLNCLQSFYHPQKRKTEHLLCDEIKHHNYELEKV
jgi:hypothetical protein